MQMLRGTVLVVLGLACFALAQKASVLPLDERVKNLQVSVVYINVNRIGMDLQEAGLELER